MRKLLILTVMSSLTLIMSGQSGTLNLKEIKSIANSKEYDALFERFTVNDTALSLRDYIIIYYGQAFRKNYQPYSRHDSVPALNKYISGTDSIDFNKVLRYTRQILSENPFNIEQIFVQAIAYEKIGETEKAMSWFDKYKKLITAILSSGDGKSEKTAMVVTKVSDEYSVLNALGLQFTGQSLINKHKKYYDRMEVSENEYGIEALYFDINLFYGKF